MAFQRARDVEVFAAWFAAEPRREKRRVGDRRREDRGCQNEVAENHTRPGERPSLARHLKNTRADQYADDHGIRFERAEIATQTRNAADTIARLLWHLICVYMCRPPEARRRPGEGYTSFSATDSSTRLTGVLD